MTDPINEERSHVAFKDGHTGNMRKIRAGLANILAYMACEREASWGMHPRFDWLLCEDQADFRAMYRGYCEYLQEERGADPGYIAKTVKDLQWPIFWAGLQAALDTEELASKVGRLARQYDSQGFRRRDRAELGAFESDTPAVSMPDVRAQLEELEQELMETVGVKDSESLTNEDRCRVAETLLLKACARGGRTVDLCRLRLGVCSEGIAVSRAWLQSAELKEEEAVLWLEEGSWSIGVLNSKGHWLHFPADDLSVLLELYSRCFPSLDLGDWIWTPSMHETRGTRSHSPHVFESSDKFGNFVESASLRLLGVPLRPYGMRRLNASRLQQKNCSVEVKQSFSALMGTGVRNLEGCYDKRTQRDKSYLAAEVQRHQDNPAFDPAQQNRILAVSKPPDVLMAAAVARLIRTEAGGNRLMALYEPGSEVMELSAPFVLLTTSEFEHVPVGLLAPEPVTGRPTARNE